MSGTDTFLDVEHSLDVLRRECSLQYDAIADRLRRWPVLLTIGRRTLAFAASHGVITVGGLGAIDASWVRIATDDDCIHCVASGQVSLADAVEDPQYALRVQGPIEGVAAAFDSIVDYVDGSMRCPELEEQLDAFQEQR